MSKSALDELAEEASAWVGALVPQALPFQPLEAASMSMALTLRLVQADIGMRVIYGARDWRIHGFPLPSMDPHRRAVGRARWGADWTSALDAVVAEPSDATWARLLRATGVPQAPGAHPTPA